MTTTVVAYTSLRLGQLTLAVSLRTSERNRRERPHQPVTLPRARSPIESLSSCSAIAAFMMCSRAALAYPCLASCAELAGQEGIEPPTPGFGDRCSAN